MKRSEHRTDGEWPPKSWQSHSVANLSARLPYEPAMRSLLAFALVALTACGAAATDSPSAAEPQGRVPTEHPVKAELVVDQSTIEPGKPFRLGVRLKMQHEWHVYWKNPGDSGLPVTLEPSGPEGSTFGKMNWPLPIEFNQPGDIAGYGYTNVVFFPIDVQPSADLKPGTDAKFVVNATWLACKDVCIPGNATLEISVPVAAKAVAANTGLFAEWQARLPVDEKLATIHADGGIAKGSVTIRLEWTEAVRSVQFFPVPESALNVTNVTVEHRERATTIRFDASVLAGQKLSSGALESLVVATDGRGTRRGISVPVQLAG